MSSYLAKYATKTSGETPRLDARITHFTTRSGDPIRVSNWRHRMWDPAAAELRLPHWATPYVLRHTTASLLAQSGRP